MNELREAIMAVVADDMDMIGEPTKSTRGLIAAWNSTVQDTDHEPIEA